jgi:hypothetical protein
MRNLSFHGGSPSTISKGIIYKYQNFYIIKPYKVQQKKSSVEHNNYVLQF